MSWNEETLRSAIEMALLELAEIKGENFSAVIQPIIWINFERGRILSFLNGHENPTPHHYVFRVAEGYEKLHPYLVELQIHRSNEAWQPLFKRMQQGAYHYFLRVGFSETKATKELADECASEAAHRILTTHFPYDVEFAPWMSVLLRNICSVKRKIVLRPSGQDISELEELLTNSSIPSGRKLESFIGLRKNLLYYLEKLTVSRKQVILMRYFEGLSLQEIAEKLGKTPNAVHQLHFYALRDLEKLFQEEGKTS